MAITHRLYRCKSYQKTPFSTGAALGRYISEDASLPPEERSIFEDFRLEPFEIGRFRYALASATPEIHALCEADPDIRAMSPEFASLVELETWLDGSLNDSELGTAARTEIEQTDRIPVDDITSSNTRREFWRRLAMYGRIGGYLQGQNEALALEVLKVPLDNTWSQLATNVRNRVRNWMATRGLDSTWIANSTTVRQVVKFITVNLGIAPNKFLRLEF